MVNQFVNTSIIRKLTIALCLIGMSLIWYIPHVQASSNSSEIELKLFKAKLLKTQLENKKLVNNIYKGIENASVFYYSMMVEDVWSTLLQEDLEDIKKMAKDKQLTETIYSLCLEQIEANEWSFESLQRDYMKVVEVNMIQWKKETTTWVNQLKISKSNKKELLTTSNAHLNQLKKTINHQIQLLFQQLNTTDHSSEKLAKVLTLLLIESPDGKITMQEIERAENIVIQLKK